MNSNINYFFNPRSIAIIGASQREGSIGNTIFVNALRPDVKYKVYPVNPKFESILGVQCYKTVLDIPGKVDLAVLAVSSRLTPVIVEQCGKKGVKAVIVIAGGFKETGPEGAKLELKLMETARKFKIRVIGPNCIGIYDTNSCVDTVFLPERRSGRPKPGYIALLTQSGAIGAAVMDYLDYYNIGVSKIISFGNKADVNEIDLLEYLKDDPKTRVISIYMEGLHLKSKD